MNELSIQNKFELDRFFNMQRGKAAYPSLYIQADDHMDEFAILVDGLPAGDLPLVVGIDDKLVEVKLVLKNMRTVRTLSKYFTAYWLVDDDQRIPLNNIEDMYNDLIDWS